MKIVDLSRTNRESRLKMVEWCADTFGTGNLNNEWNEGINNMHSSWSTNLSMSRVIFWEDAEYEIFLLKWS